VPGADEAGTELPGTETPGADEPGTEESGIEEDGSVGKSLSSGNSQAASPAIISKHNSKASNLFTRTPPFVFIIADLTENTSLGERLTPCGSSRRA